MNKEYNIDILNRFSKTEIYNIQQKIIEFLGPDGYSLFQDLKDENGTVWITRTINGIPQSMSFYPGMQIRNMVNESFPGIVKLFDDYGEYEDFIAKIVDDIF